MTGLCAWLVPALAAAVLLSVAATALLCNSHIFARRRRWVLGEHGLATYHVLTQAPPPDDGVDEGAGGREERGEGEDEGGGVGVGEPDHVRRQRRKRAGLVGVGVVWGALGCVLLLAHRQCPALDQWAPWLPGHAVPHVPPRPGLAVGHRGGRDVLQRAFAWSPATGHAASLAGAATTPDGSASPIPLEASPTTLVLGAFLAVTADASDDDDEFGGVGEWLKALDAHVRPQGVVDSAGELDLCLTQWLATVLLLAGDRLQERELTDAGQDILQDIIDGPFASLEEDMTIRPRATHALHPHLHYPAFYELWATLDIPPHRVLWLRVSERAREVLRLGFDPDSASFAWSLQFSPTFSRTVLTSAKIRGRGLARLGDLGMPAEVSLALDCMWLGRDPWQADAARAIALHRATTRGGHDGDAENGAPELWQVVDVCGGGSETRGVARDPAARHSNEHVTAAFVSRVLDGTLAETPPFNALRSANADQSSCVYTNDMTYWVCDPFQKRLNMLRQMCSMPFDTSCHSNELLTAIHPLCPRTCSFASGMCETTDGGPVCQDADACAERRVADCDNAKVRQECPVLCLSSECSRCRQDSPIPLCTFFAMTTKDLSELCASYLPGHLVREKCPALCNCKFVLPADNFWGAPHDTHHGWDLCWQDGAPKDWVPPAKKLDGEHVWKETWVEFLKWTVGGVARPGCSWVPERPAPRWKRSPVKPPNGVPQGTCAGKSGANGLPRQAFLVRTQAD